MPQPSGFSIGSTSGNIPNRCGVRRKVWFTGNLPTAVSFQRRSNTSGSTIPSAGAGPYELEPGDQLNLTFSGSSGNTYQRLPAVV